jgi:uncharacterized protein (UPF0332 family)
MSGDDFFSLAQQLATGSSPAEMRSAVSRAYYSAFHIGLDLLEAVGIQVSRGAACHSQLPQILQNGDDDAMKKIGSKLDTLRGIRNIADYKLQDPQLEKKLRAIQELMLAKEIIDGVKNCMPDGTPSEYHQAIRDYAKNILRLTVN